MRTLDRTCLQLRHELVPHCNNDNNNNNNNAAERGIINHNRVVEDVGFHLIYSVIKNMLQTLNAASKYPSVDNGRGRLAWLLLDRR